MSNGCDGDASANGNDSKNLAKEVHWIQHATFWSQVGLGIIGIFALIIYYYQLRQMQRATEAAAQSASLAAWALVDSEESAYFTLQQMEAQTVAQQNAANASVTAAETGKKTLDATVKQFKIDQRPYLVKDYMKLMEKPTVGNKLSAEVCWKNTGKTPVLNGSMFLHIDILKGEPEFSDAWEKEAKTNPTNGHIDIGAGISRCVPAQGDNPMAEYWNRVLTEQGGHVYVWGARLHTKIFFRAGTTLLRVHDMKRQAPTNPSSFGRALIQRQTQLSSISPVTATQASHFGHMCVNRFTAPISPFLIISAVLAASRIPISGIHRKYFCKIL